jgi:hypothetical protein
MRARGLLGALLVCTAVACIDMSAPRNGVLSISGVQLPSPSIVVGDVMRDSAGNPSPIAVTGFDASGHAITTMTPTFIVVSRGMHLGADNVLVGDSIATSAVIGDVGGLQSESAPVAITFPPDSATASSPDTLRLVLLSDTLTSTKLTVTLTGHNRLGATAGPERGGAQGFVVRYAVVYAPASFKADSATAFLTDGTRASAVDTTDASGVATRQAALLVHLIANADLLSGAATDSIVVDATVNPRGATVLPGPVLRFVIHVSK